MTIRPTLHLLAATLPCSALLACPALANDTITDAIRAATLKLDARVRYEYVNQDNALNNADGLTLRTRLSLASGQWQGWSALLEFEDSRQLGIDDYNDGLGSRPNYATIADPETTELDQGFIRYDNGLWQATIGRQAVLLDNQRFIGDVGWRQDRQTFDAAALRWQPLTGLTLRYYYLNQRNRIFAEARDIDANDHLLNLNWQTSLGNFSSYAYLLDDQDADSQLDSYGLRFQGQQPGQQATFDYQLEFAWQQADGSSGSFNANYYLLELGVLWQQLHFHAGLEVLGSDGGNYGFATPLATLHKFNGWSDQFLTTPEQGLEDYYVGVSGNALAGSWALNYHRFSAETARAGVDDLGDEIDLSFSRRFAQYYQAGIKYAYYRAGDAAAGKVDTDKLWLWLSASF
ncbi:alginate export family protein [Ferrimonas senticii]|uniref:alginate export family protein n=1 Tax=Ferrimonas senticii TaxID=394566 RepID=UPI0004177891|nr:alginate export family protein [Ferrimonas senticii]